MSDNLEKTTPEVKKNVLLGAVVYESYDHYQKFLEELRPDQAILILMAAVKHAYGKPGTYTMEEAELVMKSMRAIANAFKPSEKPDDQPKDQ